MDAARITARPYVLHEAELQFHSNKRVFVGNLGHLRCPALPAVLVLYTRDGHEIDFGFAGRCVTDGRTDNWAWVERAGAALSIVIMNS